MSLDMMASERVCYVQCNLCNTILAVSVPCSSLFTIVTVRCGHCANLLSVNMGTSMPTMAPQDHPQSQNNKQIIVSSEGSAPEKRQRWAHFPHIHFGLKLDGTNNKQAKLDKTIAGDHHQGTQKTNGFY
ncbi:hypothetical protein F8388_020737 [Cannabis sativa]|uniref:YABBY N-terminal domain-containing protein n=1 Tax=Cannabis sativa TaxID=3483 RepID=A0A7J6DQT7_CANSA|nr:hypothetical protein F8388_020737 [Cannabis sativa]KAF4374159.1 hypothetical protein G4B88_020551 [Cannabis sativa]